MPAFPVQDRRIGLRNPTQWHPGMAEWRDWEVKVDRQINAVVFTRGERRLVVPCVHCLLEYGPDEVAAPPKPPPPVVEIDSDDDEQDREDEAPPKPPKRKGRK
jgi:hypothetical protein